MPIFKIYGKVISTDDSGTRVLGEGTAIKDGESADALKAAWEADMRKVFKDGPHNTVEFFCRVEPV